MKRLIFFAIMLMLVFSGCNESSKSDSIKTTINIDDYILVPEFMSTEGLETETPATEIFVESGENVSFFNEEQLTDVGATYEVNISHENTLTKYDVTIIDSTAPIIEGTKDIVICVGDSISYKKGITVSDNSGENVTLSIDTSNVRINEIGTYPVTYSAIDSSGNTSSIQVNVIVQSDPIIDEDYVRPMIEEIVSKVTTEDMSDWDKAYALYQWCVKNLRYGGGGIDNTMWEAAYDAIKDKHGDCYTYSGTYAALLTVAGIDNMMVYRVGGESNHRWNLVNVGDGWYHCDSSPRRAGHTYTCFMQTDAQIKAYADSYKEKPNYYTFDTNLYPDRETKIVFEE